MHDEVKRLSLAKRTRAKLTVLFFKVSDTENIRKNLAIERMIIEGCDILLDVNQMFVRQGTLIQILPGPKGSRLPTLVGGGRGEKDEYVATPQSLLDKHSDFQINFDFSRERARGRPSVLPLLQPPDHDYQNSGRKATSRGHGEPPIKK